VKGPRNADIEPMLFDHICAAFSEIGMPPYSVIDAINNMIVDTNKDERHCRHMERERREIEYFGTINEDIDPVEFEF
jgi:hypothetical protein